MSDGSIDLFHLFLFVIPGFVFVWSYRRFANAGRPGDFEYFGQSVFFGLVILVAVQLIVGADKFLRIIGNPYSASLILCTFGIASAWAVNQVKIIVEDIRSNLPSVWKRIKNRKGG